MKKIGNHNPGGKTGHPAEDEHAPKFPNLSHLLLCLPLENSFLHMVIPGVCYYVVPFLKILLPARLRNYVVVVVNPWRVLNSAFVGHATLHIAKYARE